MKGKAGLGLCGVGRIPVVEGGVIVCLGFVVGVVGVLMILVVDGHWLDVVKRVRKRLSLFLSSMSLACPMASVMVVGRMIASSWKMFGRRLKRKQFKSASFGSLTIQLLSRSNLVCYAVTVVVWRSLNRVA